MFKSTTSKEALNGDSTVFIFWQVGQQMLRIL